MGSRISVNIHGNSVTDKNRLLQFLQAIQPRAVLVMDNFALVQEIKTLLPGTIVIYRTWPDDDIHMRVSPEEWVNRKVSELGGWDAWAYTTNEPGFSDALINWTVRVMELAQARGLKLVVGNWAVGTPEPHDWPRARRMLELLDQNRSTMIMGLHEYACGIITSGFVGGSPRFIEPQSWPQDTGALTMWHLGRFKFLLQACAQMGIRPPRIILTEHGFDDVSDIKPWAETLERAAGYLNIRGWKSIVPQWLRWFGGLGWSAERALFEQLAYADRAIYQNSPVEAQLIFSWGHSSQDWDQFDVSQAFEFQNLLATAAGAVPTPPPAPAAPVGTTTPPPAPVAPIGVREHIPAEPPPAPAGLTTMLGDLMSDDDLNTIIAGFRAAAKTGQFNSTISSGFARFADVLERYWAKRGAG